MRCFLPDTLSVCSEFVPTRPPARTSIVGKRISCLSLSATPHVISFKGERGEDGEEGEEGSTIEAITQQSRRKEKARGLSLPRLSSILWKCTPRWFVFVLSQSHPAEVFIRAGPSPSGKMAVFVYWVSGQDATEEMERN